MKLSEIVLLTVLMCVGLAGCNSKQTIRTEREGEPTIYSVQEEDAEMNAAIQMASTTLQQFKNALQSRNTEYYDFNLKSRFESPDGGEHIWISDITLKDDKFYGVVANLPESTTEVSLGDTIQIANENISDWMYVENQKLHGGYTIRLLRSRMTESERKQFDEESGWIIED